MKREKIRSRAATSVLTTAAAVFYLFMSPAYAQERPLVIARDLDVNSLDPVRSWCDTCQTYNTSVYEQLVTLDASNRIIPLLATSWKVNADQTEFTFTLDKAAKFLMARPSKRKT